MPVPHKHQHEEPPPLNETDDRFPSGPWKGFYLQPGLSDRQWMDLLLTFRQGCIRGEGHDPIGAFFFTGRYDLESGKCWGTKRYVGKHDIYYNGYNEGKGIWGTWEDPKASRWRGGFHIWPAAAGDPTVKHAAEELEEPVAV